MLQLLKTLVRRDGLSVFVSLADPELARAADTMLYIANGEAVLA